MGKRKKIPREKIVEVFSKKGCNVSATCLALGIDRGTFYKWKKADETLSEMLEEAEEAVIDNAESKLLQKINEGDTTCLIFYLKTKGKSRGYVEKTEIDATVNPFYELMQQASRQEE